MEKHLCLTIFSNPGASRQDIRNEAEAIDISSIDAYMGVLVHLSVVGGSKRSVTDLFDKTIGDDFVRSCFTRREFIAITMFIR